MRVAFDARYLTGAGSGIGTYSANLLRQMLALDPDLELLLVSRRRGAAATIDAVRCREILFRAEPRSFRTLYLLPLRLRRERFDLFHGPFNIIPSGLPRPAVVTVHDIMQLQNPANIAKSSFVQHTAGLFWRVRIRHAVRHAARVLTVSAATRDAVLERFPEVPEERVAVTPNGTDPYFLEPASSAARDRAWRTAGLRPGTPFVLMVGNESPHKNHERGVRAFLRAFASRDDIRLVLVRRSLRHDPRMVALLGQPEVARRVVVLDHIERSDLRALYQLARLFFFPSWVEGFGLPILEAMAGGCPVLTADRSAPAEVAGGAALEASPFSIEEMAAALPRLEGDEALRARLREAGRRRVDDFTWERCARLTLAAYREVVGASGSPAEPEHRSRAAPPGGAARKWESTP